MIDQLTSDDGARMQVSLSKTLINIKKLSFKFKQFFCVYVKCLCFDPVS